MSCPNDQYLETNPGLATAVVEWGVPTAADNSGDAPKITCDAVSRSEFPIGETSVTCLAFDGSNNNSTCTFQLSITGVFKKLN